ncbi:MAG: RsmD family RNA methyltransferase [Phycisphaeraceae bacterium]|nr:RsmD family RNA methyltransferase [Phycisphaerae bacterium]MBX3392120.1 RsmD family RNA methyltransferase [Phycisphaeraceae bacterium]
MRIIAGEFRSRRLLSPPDEADTRPIPDRVKESLFALLRGHVEGAAVFDGFAGSGAFGLEAISRGAARCVFVEKDRAAARMLERNIEMLGVQDRCELVVGDALGPGALARCPRPASIVLLDPPYPLVREPLGWKRTRVQFERLVECLTPDGFAAIRTPWPFFQETPPERPAAEDQDHGLGRGAGGRRARKPGPRTRTGRRHDDDGRTRDPRGETEIWSIERDEPRSLANLTEQELDEIDAREELALREAAQRPKPLRITPELSIPGAIGPETHAYGTMAVHLYQAARA